jgi:hypothetical protein
MTPTEAPTVIPACACGRKAKKSRLPSGWKRHQNTVYCDRCWRERYLLRTISVPVAAVEDISWEELRKQLKIVWAETTRISNWMTTELYVRDIRREPGMEKLPPMQHVYLYPEARQKFPSLPPQTVASIEQAMQKNYRAWRYDIIWTARVSLPNHRYPTPFPVHNQSWSASIENDRPIVSLGMGEGRVRLRLKNGPQFRRQMKAFGAIASSEAVPGELAIFQKGTVLMVRMVAWLPRPAAPQQPTGILRVRTSHDNLLIAVNAKDETVWTYNGDHLRRWAAEHRRKLQRWSEDVKFENRSSPNFAGRRKATVTKYHARMDSAAHEITAQLAGYAARRRIAAIEYNDSDQSFCTDLPWYRLRSLLTQKLDACRVALKIIASGQAAEEKPEWLVEGQDVEKS